MMNEREKALAITLIFVLVLLISVPLVSEVSAHRTSRITWRTIVPDVMWFNYTDRSIYIDLSKLPLRSTPSGDFCSMTVDLKGYTHATAALMTFYMDELGLYQSWIGAAEVQYDHRVPFYWSFNWAFALYGDNETSNIIQYVSGPPWIVRAFIGGEYFAYTLISRFVVRLSASDGENLRPITNGFWYSHDEGYNWTRFNL